MAIWIIILIAVFAVCGLGAIYMTAMIGRFGGIRALSGGKTWRRRLLSFGVLALCFTVLALVLNVVNAVMILMHVIVFFLLGGLVVRIVRAVRKGDPAEELAIRKGDSAEELAKTRPKSAQIYWQGWGALAVSVVYLSVAFFLCNNVWQTNYTLTTDKNIGALRVAVFADSHVGATFDGDGFAAHMETVMEQHPDVVLIPGDYVDDSTSREDMVRACEALGQMHPKYGVYFAYGNHDKGYYNNDRRGFTAEDLEAELKKNGVRVLKDELEILDNAVIVGRKDKSMDRQELSELLAGVDESKYIIVMDHQPNDYEKESQTPADLVVSGHTHGGQFFPVTYFGQWFGINDAVYGYERRENTDFIVTSGIADWEMLFKTGTKSEYVIIDIRADQ